VAIYTRAQQGRHTMTNCIGGCEDYEDAQDEIAKLKEVIKNLEFENARLNAALFVKTYARKPEEFEELKKQGVLS
jgi:hypothetical protein